MLPADAAAAPKPKPAARLPLPSLEQLAARVSAKDAATGPASATSPEGPARPRLAASLLARTNSTTSTTTLSGPAQSSDSLTVNPPASRNASRSASPAPAAAPAPAPAPAPPSPAASSSTHDDAAVVERLDRLDLVADRERGKAATASAVARGYKNVPSLDAITERFRGKAAAEGASVREPSKEAEPEPAKEPKKPEHPLQNKWTLYYDTKAKAIYSAGGVPPVEPPTPYIPQSTESGAYEAGLSVIGEFATVETFCRYFNWLKPPSKLERNSNYHLFKKGIKPMWEDPANANGGRWVLTMRNNPTLLDRCWNWLVFGLVGEDLEDGEEICGAVVSLRSKQDRIQVWIRSKDEVEKINSIGKKLVKLLDVSEADGIGFEFQYNTDDRPPANKFLSIQAPYPQSSYRSAFHQHTGSTGSSAAFSPDSPNAPAGAQFVATPPQVQTAPGVFPFAPGAPALGAMGTFGTFAPGWRGTRRGPPGVPGAVREEGPGA